MYTDAHNRPSNNQSLTGAAATTVSTDSIDLLTANRNIGRNSVGMRAISSVTVAFAGGTSVQAQLISSANANLSSPTVLASGPVVPVASAVAGKVLLDTPVPDTAQRYIGFQYITIGIHTGAGANAVSSHLVANTDRPSTQVEMNTGL